MAIMSHHRMARDVLFSLDYLQACDEWHAALSSVNRAAAERAFEGLRDGKMALAEEEASILPPAPKMP